MQKIIPFLWFDNNAEEAVNFYVSVFKNSKTGFVSRYDEESAKVSKMPAGTVLTIDFTLEGQQFGALNGGPIFKFSPAVSFFVYCKSVEELDELWKKLSKDGKVLMELSKYPFSERYGWCQDRFGISWQLILMDSQQKIAPCLLYVGSQAGRAKEAVDLYTSVIKNSKTNMAVPYEPGEDKVKGSHKHISFSLAGQKFVAMDSSMDHKFAFTHAISFLINCQDQTEVDKIWNTLSKGGSPEPCGWLRDKYGVSWQVVPENLTKMLRDKDPKKSKQVMGAMFQMQKLDIKKLTDAYEHK